MKFICYGYSLLLEASRIGYPDLIDSLYTASPCPNGAAHTSPGCNPGYDPLESARSEGAPHNARTV